jgi:hypothetical protein
MTDREMTADQARQEIEMGYRDLGILAEEYARLGYDRDVAAELAHRSPGPLRAMARAREEGRVEARDKLVNTPETADFAAGVPLEAAHQRERWGSQHDSGKSPWDWFWLVGYLAQKAAASAVAGDTEKAKHHTISTAAALANWHAQLSGKSNEMRPGAPLPIEAEVQQL